MILLTFRFAGEIQEIIIKGNELLFHHQGIVTSVEGLKLDKKGVMKEFPDLEGKDDWRLEAIRRLKEHIKKMNTEEERMEYVKEELKKQGYEPLFFQKAGWRPQHFR